MSNAAPAAIVAGCDAKVLADLLSPHCSPPRCEDPCKLGFLAVGSPRTAAVIPRKWCGMQQQQFHALFTPMMFEGSMFSECVGSQVLL